MLGFRHREQVWAAIQHHSRAQVCGAEEQVSQGQPRTPWQWEAGGSPCHTVACFLRGQQRTSRCPHSGARPVLGGLPYKVVLKAFFFFPQANVYCTPTKCQVFSWPWGTQNKPHKAYSLPRALPGRPRRGTRKQTNSTQGDDPNNKGSLDLPSGKFACVSN